MRFLTTLSALIAAITVTAAKPTNKNFLKIIDDFPSQSNQPPSGERYIEIWKSTANYCGGDVSKLYTISNGGKWGDEKATLCQPFNSANIQAFSIQASYGCQAFFKEGDCASDSELEKVDDFGECTLVPSDGSAGSTWSLMVICNGGTKDWPPERSSQNAVTTRSEGVVSTRAETPRFAHYWITYNDQCESTSDETATIFSGNMGDNYSEACQTRTMSNDRVWIFTKETLDCDLYLQLGDCESPDSLPLLLRVQKCVELQTNGQDVWSFKAVCGG